MCTNFTPTQRAPWVKENLGVDLPVGYPDETYPGYAAPLVVKSHRSGRVAIGLARFGLVPAWAKDDKISRYTYNARGQLVETIRYATAKAAGAANINNNPPATSASDQRSLTYYDAAGRVIATVSAGRSRLSR